MVQAIASKTEFMYIFGKKKYLFTVVQKKEATLHSFSATLLLWECHKSLVKYPIDVVITGAVSNFIKINLIADSLSFLNGYGCFWENDC